MDWEERPSYRVAGSGTDVCGDLVEFQVEIWEEGNHRFVWHAQGLTTGDDTQGIASSLSSAKCSALDWLNLPYPDGPEDFIPAQ